MKTLEFSRKIRNDNAKLKKGLKRHEWELHERTWKMGRWSLNIAPEMLHVSVGGRFRGSCLEAHVLWCAISAGQNEHWVAIETRHVYVSICFRPLLPMCGNPCQAALQ
jgi:hypothetical protein